METINSALYHEIGTGFNFTTNFNEGLSLYTDVDTVKFNITTFNITDDFTDVGYKLELTKIYQYIMILHHGLKSMD